MPIRRRDTRDRRLTFELVESVESDQLDGAASDADLVRPLDLVADGLRDRPTPGAASTGAGGRTHPLGDGAAPPSPGIRSARRGRGRAVVAGTAVVALVVAGMLVVDTARSRADLARLRAAPGAVEPMPDPPVERWTHETGRMVGLAQVPGALVMVEDGHAVARDLDSGDVRWRTEVGDGATCGASAYWGVSGDVPDDELVCLVAHAADASGDGASDTASDAASDDALPQDVVPPDSWGVVVLGEGGEVLGRREVPADGGLLFLGPDASVVRVERVGEVPTEDGRQVEVDPGTGQPVDLPAGRGVELTVSDALSGDVRWARGLDFVAGEGGCVSWGDGGTMNDTFADLENVWAATEGDLLRVEGCGVSAWFSAAGVRLDAESNPWDAISRLPDGLLYRDPEGGGMGWAYALGTETSYAPALLSPDGVVRWEPPGRVHVPLATDGRPGTPVIARDGIDLVAFDATGQELWRTSDAGTPEQIAVVAGGTVAVPTTLGGVVGLDAVTGRTRWTLEADEVYPPSEQGFSTSQGWSADQYLTDGERMVAVITDWESGAQALVAVDLADGTVAWRGKSEQWDGGSWYVAFQGRLFRQGEGTLARLG